MDKRLPLGLEVIISVNIIIGFCFILLILRTSKLGRGDVISWLIGSIMVLILAINSFLFLRVAFTTSQLKFKTWRENVFLAFAIILLALPWLIRLQMCISLGMSKYCFRSSIPGFLLLTYSIWAIWYLYRPQVKELFK